jgi:hypothetical protein
MVGLKSVSLLVAIFSMGYQVVAYTKNPLIDIYCWQDRLLSEDEELPLGSEAAINEDVFDLEDLEEDEELNADRAASQASLASSFVSALQEVRKIFLLMVAYSWGINFCFQHHVEFKG